MAKQPNGGRVKMESCERRAQQLQQLLPSTVENLCVHNNKHQESSRSMKSFSSFISESQKSRVSRLPMFLVRWCWAEWMCSFRVWRCDLNCIGQVHMIWSVIMCVSFSISAEVRNMRCLSIPRIIWIARIVVICCCCCCCCIFGCMRPYHSFHTFISMAFGCIFRVVPPKFSVFIDGICHIFGFAHAIHRRAYSTWPIIFYAIVHRPSSMDSFFFSSFLSSFPFLFMSLILRMLLRQQFNSLLGILQGSCWTQHRKRTFREIPSRKFHILMNIWWIRNMWLCATHFIRNTHKYYDHDDAYDSVKHRHFNISFRTNSSTLVPSWLWAAWNTPSMYFICFMPSFPLCSLVGC